MKARCLQTVKGQYYSITKDEIYDVVDYDEYSYELEDDNGQSTYFFKTRFEVIEEVPQIKAGTIYFDVELKELQEMKDLLLEIEEIYNRIFKRGE